jgi:hypothetical protein
MKDSLFQSRSNKPLTEKKSIFSIKTLSFTKNKGDDTDKELYKYILKYEAIYEVPEIQQAFWKYLQKENKGFYFQFALEFKKFPNYETPEDKLEILRKLVGEYILPNGKKYLKVKNTTTRNIITKLKTSGQLEASNWVEDPKWVMDCSLEKLFEEIYEEIYAQLQTESYSKFLTSSSWKNIEKYYQFDENICEKMKIYDVVEQVDKNKKWKRKNEVDEKKDKKNLFNFMSKESNKKNERNEDRKSASFLQKISDLKTILDSPRKKKDSLSNSFIQKNEMEKKNSTFKNWKDKFSLRSQQNSDSDSDEEPKFIISTETKNIIYTYLMRQSIQYLNDKGERNFIYLIAIDIEGIFRKSGSEKIIKKFILDCQKNSSFNLETKLDFTNEIDLVSDIHNIAGIVITSLQDISEPFITFQLYNTFLETDGIFKVI